MYNTVYVCIIIVKMFQAKGLTHAILRDTTAFLDPINYNNDGNTILPVQRK